MSDVSAAEQAIIRTLVEDHAADYYGGPLNLGRSDAARYVTEGHVDKAIPRVDWRDLWRLVAVEIDANPGVLTASQTDRAARIAARNAEAGDLMEQAADAFLTRHDAPAALVLVDRAELVAPLHRPGGRGYDTYRDVITRGAKTAA